MGTPPCPAYLGSDLCPPSASSLRDSSYLPLWPRFVGESQGYTDWALLWQLWDLDAGRRTRTAGVRPGSWLQLLRAAQLWVSGKAGGSRRNTSDCPPGAFLQAPKGSCGRDRVPAPATLLQKQPCGWGTQLSRTGHTAWLKLLAIPGAQNRHQRPSFSTGPLRPMGLNLWRTQAPLNGSRPPSHKASS